MIRTEGVNIFFPIKHQIANISGIMSYVVSVTTTQLHHCSLKATTDNMEMKVCDRTSTKFSLSTLKCKFYIISPCRKMHACFDFFFPVIKKCETLGFPGGAVVGNLPVNAGDTGSSPGLGRSHMPRSNWAREPQLLSPRVWSLCSATGEAAIVRGPRTAMKSGPRLLQLEKALAQKRRPNTAINKLINLKKDLDSSPDFAYKKKNVKPHLPRTASSW